MPSGESPKVVQELIEDDIPIQATAEQDEATNLQIALQNAI